MASAAPEPACWICVASCSKRSDVVRMVPAVSASISFMPRSCDPNMCSIFSAKLPKTSVSILLTASPWLWPTAATALEMRVKGSVRLSLRLVVIEWPSCWLVVLMVAICCCVSSVRTCFKSVTRDSFICIAWVAEVSAASTSRCRYSSPAPASNSPSIRAQKFSSSLYRLFRMDFSSQVATMASAIAVPETMKAPPTLPIKLCRLC